MQTIKIKFMGFWSDFNKEKNFITEILEKHYLIEISDNPDYIFCSVLGNPYECYEYKDAVRIMFSEENWGSDFNTYDYVIGFDRLCYGERYLRYPLYLLYKDDLKKAEEKHIGIDGDLLKTKDKFCSMLYSHDTDNNDRKKIMEKLSEYRKVDSAGTYLNNMQDGKVISQREKLRFQNNYKFSIAYESCQLEGFVTEKILQGFASQTVPVYLGDPNIKNEFNERAFIDCSGCSLDEIKEKVMKIDKNDELYLEMLNQPIFNDERKKIEETELERFLMNIFAVNKEEAFKRPRGPLGSVVMANERKMYFLNRANKIYAKLKNISSIGKNRKS